VKHQRSGSLKSQDTNYRFNILFIAEVSLTYRRGLSISTPMKKLRRDFHFHEDVGRVDKPQEYR